MVTVVKDTNILIDLFNTGLIRYCQQLDISFHTTTYVAGEVINAGQWRLFEGLMRNGVITVDSFEGEQSLELSMETSKYQLISNLSQADCSVMLLAERLSCRLLTADKKLRHHAELRGVSVSGFLWIVDQFVEAQIVTPEEMIGYLKIYKETNSRIPKETEALINKYKQMVKNQNNREL